MREGEELFSQINVPMQDTLEGFVALAQKTIAEQEGYFTAPPGNDGDSFESLTEGQISKCRYPESGIEYG